MSVRVVETEHYRRKAVRLLSEAERSDLCVHLAENPEAHDVVPGLGGLRKVYSKDEKEDLTNDDKKRLRQRLEKIKAGLT